MQTVNEARYAFWKTIIEIEQASGQPKDEWCDQNKISLKTFNHYEGIFRRQKARGYTYKGSKNSFPQETPHPIKVEEVCQPAVLKENILDTQNQEQEKSEGKSNSSFVEIPVYSDIPVNLSGSGMDEKEDEAHNEPEVVEDQIRKVPAADQKNNREVVIQIGDCRLSIGEGVNESTLRTVLKAVGGYA